MIRTRLLGRWNTTSDGAPTHPMGPNLTTCPKYPAAVSGPISICLFPRPIFLSVIS